MCPSCRARKPRRSCPALGARICPVCCGTKRVVEIACPSDCGYLASSRTHPPAQALRRRDHDLRFLLPVLHRLPERAYHLLLVLQDGIAEHRHAAIPSIDDADVAEAVATLAGTYETAARGIIYEHQAHSVQAQRLVRGLRELIGAVQRRAGTTSSLEQDLALALRRIEQAARTAREELEPSRTAYLDLLQRLPRDAAEGESLVNPPDRQGAPGDGRQEPGGQRIVLP
jgi:hypothetical protein